MDRNQYINNVKVFSAWLAQHLYDSTFATSYVDRRTGSQRRFNSLFDAYQNYYWPYHEIVGLAHPPATYDFSANMVALSHLRNNLVSALSPQTGSDTAMRDSAIDVMTWGGVRPGNVMWLQNQHDGLKNLVAQVQVVLNSQNTVNIPRNNLRFNSGMTKVYSLICNDFIIYDSRVAAALGWAVTKFCQETGLATVPSELAFPWAPAKESNEQPNPKRRDPSIGNLRFPPLRPGNQHATWNLKASWLLKDALERAPDGEFNRAADPLRALEAALFMIGYDLPSLSASISQVMNSTYSSPPQDSDPKTDSSIPGGDWNDSETLRKAIGFRYRLQEGGIEVIKSETGRRMFFSVGVIESTLGTLWKDFSDTPFPLSNDAIKVRNGTAKPGLGTAYFRANDGKGNPPDASFLAAVLLEAMNAIIPANVASSKNLHWRLNIEKFQLDKQSGPAVRDFYKSTLDGVDSI